jgi:hypothetical protein
MKDEKMILDTSDEAAKFVTGISGWVSRDGHFCGNDERIARYIGSTHKLCECGNIVEKMWIKCDRCRARKLNSVSIESPRRSGTANAYCSIRRRIIFLDYSALVDYCEVQTPRRKS